MIFSLQASEIAAGKLHAVNGPAEPGQAQGEGWVQFTAPKHIHSPKTATSLLLGSRHRRCCRGLCQACCTHEAAGILDIESLCAQLFCAGSYAIWLAFCHLALCHDCSNARTLRQISDKQNVACRSDARSCMWRWSLSQVPSLTLL